MTKRTTADWQQLLDGATEGPWEWIDEPDDADAQYIVDCNTGNMCLSVDAIGSGSSYEPSDPLLAAAAPEAVAEVVRLRKALDELAHGAYVMANQHYYMGGERYDDLGSTEQSYYEALTRILEGGNDERPADDAGAGSC